MIVIIRNLPALEPDTPSSTRAIDLLPLIDLRQDTVRGTWKKTAAGLRIDKTHVRGVLGLPVTTEGSYRLSFQFSHISGSEGPTVVFPVGNRHARFDLACFPRSGSLTGIGEINDKQLDKRLDALKIHRGFAVQDSQKYVVEVSVLLGAKDTVTINAHVDGQQLAAQDGLRSELSVHPDVSTRKRGQPGLSVRDASIVFHWANFGHSCPSGNSGCRGQNN